MNNFTKLSLALLLTGYSMAAFAVPTLQIDIEGASYDGSSSEESVVTKDRQFTLNALLNEDKDTTLLNTFFLSVAIIPSLTQTNPAPDLGSIVIDGTSYNVTSDMNYGTPPLDVALESQNLAPHGIFETYYLELEFTFDVGNTAAKYNVQDNPGFLQSGTGAYFNSFNFDIAGLAAGYDLHFDLYDLAMRNGDTILGEFAPFSHDARTDVPEPGMVALLSIGLLGMVVTRRRMKV